MKNIKIIPFGENCMPRVILTRWGIKKRKLFGEPSYPFDLAVFGMPEITKSLRTDFNEIFDNLEYKNDCWIKAPDCIYFYHDKRFKMCNKDKLISLYTKRIENFRAASISDTPILFVQILGDFEDIENQYAELKKIRQDKPFKLAVIDTQNILKKTFSDDIHILKNPLPSEDYKQNWWKKKYYNSKEGREFERRIADFCTDIIKTI